MATVSIRSVSGAVPVAEWIEGRLGHIVNAHRDALDAVVLALAFTIVTALVGGFAASRLADRL